MIYSMADNVVSSLGFTTEDNWQALLQAKTGLRYYDDAFDLPEPIFASLIPKDRIEDAFTQICHNEMNYTRFEKMAILSAFSALEQTTIDAASSQVLFILSTTKGNVELLEDNQGFEKNRVCLWRSAQLISQFFGNPNEPIVVSNACISGVSAQITAARYLRYSSYQYVVVVGADVLSKFVVSGFQSFKSLSATMCKPFDKERVGLNLGEAAATIILSNNPIDVSSSQPACLVSGAVCNDANHISGPSRTAEGAVKVIQQTLKPDDIQNVAFVSAHGTATRYNDDMESIALSRCQLNHLPVNSLKGYYGHTLGAAGVLETIISYTALRHHTILKSMGTQQVDTAQPLNVCFENTLCPQNGFLKIISGFGGSNAAVYYLLNY